MKVLTTSLTRAMGFFFRRSGMLSIPYRLDPPLQAAEKRVRKEREKSSQTLGQRHLPGFDPGLPGAQVLITNLQDSKRRG